MVTLLKGLGITDEYLAARVLCIWPAVLSRDVDSELRPVVTFFMALGLEVRQGGGAPTVPTAPRPLLLVRSLPPTHTRVHAPAYTRAHTP